MDASGRSRLICQPSSRTGENPPYGMIGRIEETSASFEARSAPRSHPTTTDLDIPDPRGSQRFVSRARAKRSAMKKMRGQAAPHAACLPSCRLRLTAPAPRCASWGVSGIRKRLSAAIRAEPAKVVETVRDRAEASTRRSRRGSSAAQRWTSTGILPCVRTLTVSLPRTIAEMPWRPCEAMTIRSQPFNSAVSRIAR